jgi:hypothetical protein
VIGAQSFTVSPGNKTLSITLSTAAASKLTSAASLLVSFVNAQNEVQAFDLPLSSFSQDTPVGGTVPATLSLTLGAPAQFGAFTPGVTKTYLASTNATVLSTAGDATLSVADDTGDHPGHLVNGAFALASPIQGLGTIKTWSAPTSNETVPIAFEQSIAADEPLRTGTYSKTLTFTLSTTNP